MYTNLTKVGKIKLKTFFGHINPVFDRHYSVFFETIDGRKIQGEILNQYNTLGNNPNQHLEQVNGENCGFWYACDDTKVAVPVYGWVNYPFGVFGSKRNWSVFHLPTGLMFSSTKLQKNAKKLIKLILDEQIPKLNDCDVWCDYETLGKVRKIILKNNHLV